MSEKRGFRYRWASPSAWLEHRHPDHHYVLGLYDLLDNDVIQNAAESEMSSDGYFEPEAGVYVIDFEPDPEVLAELNEARWEAEPLYADLMALGCKFLGLTTRASGICTFTMACPCPMEEIATLDGVEEVDEATTHVIARLWDQDEKRKIIEDVV